MENLAKKCVNVKASIKFNKTCINYGLYPNYTNIKLRGQAVTNNEEARKLKNQIIKDEITAKTQLLDNINAELDNAKSVLKNMIEDELYTVFMNRIASSDEMLVSGTIYN
jgi:hypothetical protein